MILRKLQWKHLSVVTLLIALISIAPATASTPKKASIPTPVFNTSGLSTPIKIGSLIWSDEFLGKSGALPNESNWSSNIGNYKVDSINIYSPSMSILDGSKSGSVNISSKKINDPSLYHGLCGGGKFCQFQSGEITTRNLVTFKYGYIEARMKMPKGVGNWPAFWLLRDGNYQAKVSTPGEIDVMEWFGNFPNKSWSTLHFPGTSLSGSAETTTAVTATTSSPNSLSDSFHIYGIAWLPSGISFFLDGKLIRTIDSSSISTWPFDNFFYLILSTGVGPQPNNIFGGTWDGWQSSTFSIDYVRDWKLNGYGEVVKKSVTPMTPEQMLAMLHP